MKMLLELVSLKHKFVFKSKTVMHPPSSPPPIYIYPKKIDNDNNYLEDPITPDY